MSGLNLSPDVEKNKGGGSTYESAMNIDIVEIFISQCGWPYLMCTFASYLIKSLPSSKPSSI